MIHFNLSRFRIRIRAIRFHRPLVVKNVYQQGNVYRVWMGFWLATIMAPNQE